MTSTTQPTNLQFPVHARHLGWAHSQVDALGIPWQAMPSSTQPGIYIVVVPAAAAPTIQGMPWVYVQPRRRNWMRWVVAGGVVALIAVAGWFAVGFLRSEPAPTPKPEPGAPWLLGLCGWPLIVGLGLLAAGLMVWTIRRKVRR